MCKHYTNRNHQSFSLTYLDRFKIKYEKEGLNEPSGLALSHDKNALWTISDDTQKIFYLSLDGDLNKDVSFKIEDNGLEGIVLDSSGEFLLAVKEDNNEIIQIKVNEQKTTHRQRLAEMSGYDAIAHYFADEGVNKGLEGITLNKKTGTVFLIKECNPGLLLEVSSDLMTVRSHQLLNDENGFLDSEAGGEKVSTSQISATIRAVIAFGS